MVCSISSFIHFRMYSGYFWCSICSVDCWLPCRLCRIPKCAHIRQSSFCPTRVSTAVPQNMTQSNLTGEGVFQLVESSAMQGNYRGNSRQQAGGGNWSRDQGWRLLTDWLLLADLVFSLELPGPPAQGRLPIVDCTLYHYSLLKKIFRSLVYHPNWSKHFLNWGSFFSDDSRLCQTDIKSNNIIAICFFFFSLVLAHSIPR